MMLSELPHICLDSIIDERSQFTGYLGNKSVPVLPIQGMMAEVLEGGWVLCSAPNRSEVFVMEHRYYQDLIR